ncbi:ABC transporter permease subunit [Mycolicibacterium komossense]|uniref:ABC transporter permease subunit n=1 Tax=Mycolicibacterium komossense TaxID=1779 RepID=A0ABT3C7D0_9MYCO|nr:ABC transporter permease subunit [Mycolicibacterium komossense]MCV7225388.1 ABC transporter permease subunit [Mycolicibacterium komossense]
MSATATASSIGRTTRERRSALGARGLRFGLLLPVIVVYALFFVWPILTVFLRSISEKGRFDAAAPRWSFDAYARLFQDDFLLLVEWRTVVLAVNSTLITILLAFPTAYFISRLRRRTATLMLLLVLVPFWISIVVRLFSVTSILSPNGPLNQLSMALGFGPLNLLYTPAGTLVGTVMYLLPYMILVLYAGMAAVDTNLLLAARTMGSSATRTFFTVYLPLIRSSLVSGGLLIFILGLGFFIVPAILGGPTEQTISVYIQQQIDIFRWAIASAMGILLLVATVICYIGVVRVTGEFKVGVGSVQVKGVSAEQPFRWSIPMAISAAISALTIAVLVIPVLFVFPLSIGETGTVVFPPRGFTLKWYAEVFTTTTWLGPIGRSLLVGIGTGALSVAIGLVLARLMRSTTSTVAKAIISGLAFAPIITPGILLAIGMFDVQLQLGLTGTVFGLILAHTIVAAPLAFALIAAAMSGSDPGLEEAAWTLGASRTRAFWTVVVKAILPSVAGAFVIAFVTSWDEVVLALFLQTGPTKTLPVTIYKYLQSGIVPTVPAVASLLVTSVLVILVIRGVFNAVRNKRAQKVQES